MDVELEFLASESKLASSVVGIGVFDGVHLAHQELIGRVVQHARATGRPSVVLTFDPHPQEVLTGHPLPRLASLEERLARIARIGVDSAKVLRFSREFSQASPEEFVRDVLVARLAPVRVVVGFNFTFGRGGRGNAHTLAELGAKYGFDVETVESVSLGDQTVSSSAIRQSLESGDVENAARLLGQPYTLTGVVTTGAGRGRTIGFPTANLAPRPETLKRPGKGVYSADATPEGGATYPALVNIGTRPTFDGTATEIVPEIYLHGFSGDLVGKGLSVTFLSRVRDEKRFGSVSELVEQIKSDLARVLGHRGLAGEASR